MIPLYSGHCLARGSDRFLPSFPSKIDPVFTSEKAVDSVVETSELAKTAEGDNDDFNGFTYVAPTVMGAD